MATADVIATANPACMLQPQAGVRKVDKPRIFHVREPNRAEFPGTRLLMDAAVGRLLRQRWPALNGNSRKTENVSLARADVLATANPGRKFAREHGSAL